MHAGMNFTLLELLTACDMAAARDVTDAFGDLCQICVYYFNNIAAVPGTCGVTRNP